MIGVAVHSSEREIAAEFFELFKTPWEFYRPGQRYEVVLCTQDQGVQEPANLVLRYGGERTAFDSQNQIAVRTCATGASAAYGNHRLPLYGNAVVFPKNRFSEVYEHSSRRPMAFLTRLRGTPVMRIGYDLFREVRSLLTIGQPPANAGIPTLELHSGLLRDLITRSGVPLIEIPPVPEGHKFTACLTHDLDHPALRNHWCDHTMFGFLYRATVGSLVHVCQGRKPVRSLCRNWAAAARLPFVYLGIARDPWRGFDGYLAMEAGVGSTYFVIPKKGYAGRRRDGSAPARRASRYTVRDVKPQLEKVLSAGCEVGMHGIDAWLDSDSGCAEREEMVRSLGARETGVRMHWLFFDEQSPVALDRAGFSYDSSFGYNQTVGYRAGTAQAYKPIGAANLLELPLHVMDTALFYPNHLNLSETGAERVVWPMVAEVAGMGGALTVNWHDRSIAPERLWDGFYARLVSELKRQGAWMPTAAQAVLWFRKRRSAVFNQVAVKNGAVRVSATASAADELPGLRIRVHKPRSQSLFEGEASPAPARYVETAFHANVEQEIAI